MSRIYYAILKSLSKLVESTSLDGLNRKKFIISSASHFVIEIYILNLKFIDKYMQVLSSWSRSTYMYCMYKLYY